MCHLSSFSACGVIVAFFKVSGFICSLTWPYTSLSVHFFYILTLPLPCYLTPWLCSNHFLCWPCTLCFTQPNFKQIWQEGAGLCNRGGRGGGCRSPGLPLRKETARPGCNEKLILTVMVLMDKYGFCQKMSVYCKKRIFLEELWCRVCLCSGFACSVLFPPPPHTHRK